MIDLCEAVIGSTSKYNKAQPRLCQREQGHTGKHVEFPFLAELQKTHPGVRRKIARDAFMTTGAAWKSAKAGPNRILRWVMLLPNEQLLQYGLDMSELQPQVIAKLREKSATYMTCMNVAKKLTWLTYQMPEAPVASQALTTYLTEHFGVMTPRTTRCLVCKGELSFTYFSAAVRGKAHIETAHSDPRYHNADNIGFAHRECNIAQGNKTLADFYQWLREILERVQ